MAQNNYELLSLHDSLSPGQKYYYRFGDDAYGWSDEFTFTSAPVPGPNVTTRVLTFGGSYTSYIYI